MMFVDKKLGENYSYLQKRRLLKPRLIYQQTLPRSCLPQQSTSKIEVVQKEVDTQVAILSQNYANLSDCLGYTLSNIAENIFYHSSSYWSY